jgi:hypothetical protein
MKTPGSNRPFQPQLPDAAGVISWFISAICT